MTQVWPGLGVAPVPTLPSVICSPDAVVMVFAACAIDAVDVPTARMPVNAAARTIAARVRTGGRTCIVIPLLEFAARRLFRPIASAPQDPQGPGVRSHNAAFTPPSSPSRRQT